MTKRPGLKDVAALAGVSATTVSHVINKTRHVDEMTEKRVLDAIDQLHYVNNQWARMLKTQKSNVICLCIGDFNSAFDILLLYFAELYLTRLGYLLHLAHFTGNPEVDRATVDGINAMRVCGIILHRTRQYDIDKFCATFRHIPIVCAPGSLHELDGDPFDTVDTDHEEATYTLVSEMTHKYSRIAFIHGDSFFLTSKQRLDGYRRALADAHIVIDPKLVVCGESCADGGYRAMKKLADINDIQAIFVSNNAMMEGVFRAINEVDPSIPNRVAIVGFDNENWYALVQPSLTCIEQPVKQIMERAIDILLERINGSDRPLVHEVIPSRIIYRDSFRPIEQR